LISLLPITVLKIITNRKRKEKIENKFMHEKILLQKEAAVNTFAKRYSLISLANKTVVSFIAY